MKSMFIPKMNIFVMIFVLLSFVIVDTLIVPRIVTYKISADSDFRIPARFGYAELRVFIDQMNQETKPKIILVGDSIVHGGGVNKGTETISFHLQQELDRRKLSYQVYNAGLSGAAPADVFFVLKSMKLTDKDIVIYNLNIGHFGSTSMISYPHITALLTAQSYKNQPLSGMLNLEREGIEERLQRWIRNGWKLYAYRELLYEIWNEKVHHEIKEEIVFDTLPWYEKEWEEKTKGSAKRGGFILNERGPHLYFFTQFLELTKDSGAKIVVFNSPLNQEMMDTYDMIDRFRYDRNINRLAEVTKDEGAVYYDYEKRVASEYFADSLHPLSEGNLLIAQALIHDLRESLVREVSK